MKGETTLEERIKRQFDRMEEVRKLYNTRFNQLDEHDFISQLIADATWLATWEGYDLETIIEEMVGDVRRDFPDTC